MAEPSQEITNLRATLSKIASIDVPALLGNQGLGKFKFADAHAELQETKQLARVVLTLDLAAIPERIFFEIRNEIGPVFQCITNVQQFVPSEFDDPVKRHQELSQRLHTIGTQNARLCELISKASVFEIRHREMANQLGNKLESLEKALQEGVKTTEERIERLGPELTSKVAALDKLKGESLQALSKHLQRVTQLEKEWLEAQLKWTEHEKALSKAIRAELQNVIKEFHKGAGTPEELRNALQKFETDRTNAFDQVRQTGSDIKVLADRARQTVSEIEQISGKGGIALHAKVFEHAAKRHRRAERTWLAVTFLLMIATGAGTYLLLANATKLTPDELATNASTVVIIRDIVGRLVILSIGYFAIVWSARNCRTQRNLAVANEHRRNALITFKVFVRRTEDPSLKDAILLEATRCIFAPADTEKEAADEQVPIQQLLTLFKQIAEKAK